MTDMRKDAIPSFDLAGKRALVTGASRGIGLAAAQALAAYGAHVTLIARPSRDLDSAVAALLAAGHGAEALELDVNETARARELIAAREPYDILINNAGINYPVTFLDVTEAQYDAIMTLNVRALYFIAQAVAAKLVASGRPGSIINISSQMGHVGAAIRTVYCASKWAVEGLTKAMAVDLAPHGIRVNTIGPTFIETPLASRFRRGGLQASGAEQDQARSRRPGRRSDGCDRLPRLRRIVIDDRCVDRHRWGLDRGLIRDVEPGRDTSRASTRSGSARSARAESRPGLPSREVHRPYGIEEVGARFRRTVGPLDGTAQFNALAADPGLRIGLRCGCGGQCLDHHQQHRCEGTVRLRVDVVSNAGVGTEAVIEVICVASHVAPPIWSLVASCE